MILRAWCTSVHSVDFPLKLEDSSLLLTATTKPTILSAVRPIACLATHKWTTWTLSTVSAYSKVDTYVKILSKPQLNHNSTQPNITLSWVRHENDFANHPTTTTTTTTETQCHLYFSCYWTDFDETLNVGSWEHLEQILNPILNPNIEPQYWAQY